MVIQNGLEKVALTDNTDGNLSVVGGPTILEGVEECIGNTPLIKIKSLSEATGCDILAKAEVREHRELEVSI